MHPTLSLQDNTEHLTAKDVFLWNALEHLYRTMTAESLSRSLQRCQLGPTRTAFHLWRWCPPSLFKVGGSPFDILPGGTSPERVRPDIVHTFHLPPEPGSSKSLVSPQSVGKPRFLLCLGENPGFDLICFDDKIKWTALNMFRTKPLII